MGLRGKLHGAVWLKSRVRTMVRVKYMWYGVVGAAGDVSGYNMGRKFDLPGDRPPSAILHCDGIARHRATSDQSGRRVTDLVKPAVLFSVGVGVSAAIDGVRYHGYCEWDWRRRRFLCPLQRCRFQAGRCVVIGPLRPRRRHPRRGIMLASMSSPSTSSLF